MNEDESMGKNQSINQHAESDENQQEAVGNLPKIISFETLAKCGEEIWIENKGQIYRLRRTKQDKLILTK